MKISFLHLFQTMFNNIKITFRIFIFDRFPTDVDYDVEIFYKNLTPCTDN